jgi:Protein kinase domain
MADDEVWVQLYIGKDKSGRVLGIDIASLDGKKRIQELAEAVYNRKKDNALAHTHSDDLFVYKAGTECPAEGEEPLDPGDAVSKHTTSSKNPLRVVAPSPPEQRMLRGTQESDMRLVSATTEKILNAWSAAPPQVPMDIDSLAEFVISELPSPLPYMPVKSLTNDNAVHDVIDPSKKEGNLVLLPELSKIRDNILASERLGTTEDTLHPIAHSLILSPINLLGRQNDLHFTMDRNSTDPSGATQKKLRPDVLVWLPSGVLAFKGEEKANSLDLEDAIKELSQKLAVFTDAFFGNLPYQLCFAMGGLELQFLAIKRQGNGQHSMHRLTLPVNLGTIRGRSLCVRYAVNIARLLIALHHQNPHGNVIRLGAKIITESCEVHIFGNHVIKKPKKGTGALVLLPLYDLLIRSQGVEGLVQVMETKCKGRHITLHLQPVGLCGQKPASIEEAKVAGKRVLTALQYLHDNEWVHRDIRPENVMFADGKWYLMDLEWANVVDSPIGEYSPQEAWIPPEITGENSYWTTASDMWQFHRLLSDWDKLDDEGRNLVRVLRDDNLHRRLTAAQALAHAFFQ